MPRPWTISTPITRERTARLTETDDKAEAKPARKSASFWHNQLDYAAKREEKWRKKGDDVQCRYMDDRDHYEGGKQFEKRINILWSNTEVQKGALFSRLGNPDVRRAFPLPGKANKIARTAALVVERALVACGNRYDPDCEIENAVEDQLLPGRGQCWLEYDPTVEEYEETDDAGKVVMGEYGKPVMASRVTYQEVKFCHVEWKSFRHGNGRSWEDVPWVARELLFTKSDLKKRWGAEVADLVPVNQVIDEEHINAESKKDGSFKRARVWEIWYKPEAIRVYVAEGYPHELEREDDPYKLEGFFPCPRPLYAVKTASCLTPRPEFLQYQDQCDELDRVNTRIWKLLEKLKYCGVYDGSAEDMDSLSGIGNLQDGQFLPYKNFAALASAGGLAEAFQVRDLAPIAAAIQALAKRAIELIQSIYEVTGISDIMRGASDSAETATAQSIKAKFGSGRLQRKQREVARFVKALYRMKGEIISEHFEREQLVQMTGIPLPLEIERKQAQMQLEQFKQYMQMAQQAQQQQGQPAPQLPPPPLTPEDAKELETIADACTWEEIASVLRSDDRRNYSINMETDVTAFEDEEAEKAAANEFMAAMTNWLGQAIPAVQANPSLAPLMKELTMMYVGKFKPGRSLEEAFEDSFEQVKNAPPQPDPEAAKLKAEMEMEEKRFQMDMQLKQADLASKQQTAEINAQGKQADLAAKQQATEMDMQAKRLDLQLKQVSAQLDMMLKKMEMGIKQEELGVKREEMHLDRQAAHEQHQMHREELAINAQAKREEAEINRDSLEFNADMKRQEAEDRRIERQQAAKDKRAAAQTNGAA